MGEPPGLSAADSRGDRNSPGFFSHGESCLEQGLPSRGPFCPTPPGSCALHCRGRGSLVGVLEPDRWARQRSPLALAGGLETRAQAAPCRSTSACRPAPGPGSCSDEPRAAACPPRGGCQSTRVRTAPQAGAKVPAAHGHAAPPRAFGFQQRGTAPAAPLGT